MTHVDEFIDKVACREIKGDDSVLYAAWMLNYFRFPAYMSMMFSKITQRFHLFCLYKDKWYRVTGASRMGDIYLTEDMNRSHGYELRIDVGEVTMWSNTPGVPYDENKLPPIPVYS